MGRDVHSRLWGVAPLKVLPFPLAAQLPPYSVTDKHGHLFPQRAQFIIV